MDITLERMLTLIPKKENGNFKHGALSQFARSIGFKDGHIVSDWIAGNSESYKNYIYQVSALYHVSVEWLQGKTEDKRIKEKPSAISGELVGNLPEDVQKLIQICRETPGLASDLLSVALRIKSASSAQG